MVLFQTKRSRQVDMCMQQIIKNTAHWIICPSVVTVASMLQKSLRDHGRDISLQNACHEVVRYSNIRRKFIVSDTFKPIKISYPATIRKSQPNLWSKIAGFFHRKPQPKTLREYLLLDDQLAYSGKYEYYEHIEDEE